MNDSAGDDSAADDGSSPVDAELAAAVDEALGEVVRRQRARFIQEIMSMDRMEGVGRSRAELEDRAERVRRDREAEDSSD